MPKSPEKISDLLPDRKNRRKHTARNVEMLQESLEKVGTGRSIVIDENNEVLAGNATIKAAQNIGLTKVKVIEVDGTEIVAVRRTGLTDEQKRDLAIYDNRVAEFAEWDTEQLLEDTKEGGDLTAFFHDEELQSLMDGAEVVNLDQFFESDTGGVSEEKISLVLKFSLENHHAVLAALQAHGKSPEQSVLKVLGIM